MNELSIRTISAVIGGAVFLGSYFGSSFYFSALLLVVLFYILIFEWTKLISYKKYVFWILTPLYPVLPCLLLIYLNISYRDRSLLLPLYPYFIVWTFDTAGYAIGKLYGKHKVYPSISAGKSWEGLIAGFMALIPLNFFLFRQANALGIVGLSLLFGVLSFLGDTIDSYLKRRVNLKDSGDILPGHGGLLDRFASAFLVAPGIVVIFLLNDLQLLFVL